MSRIGKKPISVPSGVTVDLTETAINVKGPKGSLAMNLQSEVETVLADSVITLKPRDETKRARSMWGMQRTRISNLIEGVTEGFKKELEINGVGYRAAVKGKTLELQLGFSHDVNFPIPEGIEIKCDKPTSVHISGIDKQVVGQVAAEIRSYRPPEPFKGKGVKYVDEYIFRKEGKKK